MKVPGVKAVITGKDLEAAGLGWLPTFHGFDKQMVLAIGKVLFQYQEVAAVFAETRAAAVDGAEAVQVDYAPLPVVADPFASKTDRCCCGRIAKARPTTSSIGKSATRKDGPRAGASPKTHQGAPLVPALSSRAARAVRLRGVLRHDGTPAVSCDVAGAACLSDGVVAGHRYSRRRDSRDLAGPRRRLRQQGAGLSRLRCAIVGALKIGRPVKWIETRTENLTSTGFARDYHMDVEIGATADGRVTALRVSTTADHGAFDAAADPTKYPAGIFGIVTGSYDFPVAHAEVHAYFTNKAPGGSPIAARSASLRRATPSSAAWTSSPTSSASTPWRCAGRISSRRRSFRIRPRWGSPTTAATITRRSTSRSRRSDTRRSLKEQAEKRARGELMGIGFSTFTEVVGAGPSKHFDILGIKMFDSAEIRIHPTGAGIVRTGAKSQGQGHETTWAQIVAEELGLDPQTIMVEEGDTDTAPYGLGTYASRSTPVAGAAIVMAARRIREKARKIAAHLLEVGEGDVEWIDYKFQVKGVPTKTVTMKEVAFAAYTNMAQNEPGLEATYYYDPPNMTYPNGAYVAVVDIDRETGETKVRRFVAVDDCGVVINPMIVEGQIEVG